ncbi:UbiA prenyltransferase family protein [Prauserella muralis]|uniref:Uncharacterized protein n=1 Tax=Prauserella muralis TaxID=588067 RepID=A0A2V4AYH4_9PSEU|nr:UbiA family prenyltransferase [Prauserella muralis]PXY26942.1 hypothetical protein BAY60_10590 [Prauserella muralis]TWE23446.1 putative secreted protein [Prauserella muralis]
MPRLARGSVWRDLVAVHRLEYTLPVNYLCYATWGAGFAAAGTDGAGALPTGPVLVAVLANLLLIVGPLALNVAVDVTTDERHGEKGYLASAVSRIGRVRMLRWAIAELASGLVLSIVVTVWTGSWLPAVAGTMLVAAQLAYNVEPVRLKRRGFAGPVAFGLASVSLPFLVSYGALSAVLPAAVWLLVAGVGVLSIGRTVWWSLPDRMVDTASGVTTPSVRYGVARTVVACAGILLSGAVAVAGALWWLYGPLWALLGIVAHAVYIGDAARLLTQVSDHSLPSARRMLKRAMPLVTLGDVLLLVVALANL